MTILPNSNANIDTYVTINDPLTIAQNFSCLPKAYGTIHLCLPKNHPSIPLSGHAINNFYELPLKERLKANVKEAFRFVDIIMNLFK